MLGKTANGLFWMYRYLERAENTTRLIETGQRIALTRLGASDREWKSILQTAGDLGAFQERYGSVSRDVAIDWLLRSRDNSSSVMSSIASARQNARMVRTAVTDEVWEAMNGAYMRAQGLLARQVPERELPRTLGAVRQGTALVRGATHGTMMRNDCYDFARLGTFLERADNTARILDVKYYVLLPDMSAVGSSLDNVQWETILRSVSGRGGFRSQYGNSAGPRDIAQFLILDKRMPRSLAFCAGKLCDNLGYLASQYGRQQISNALVDELRRKYLSHDIDAIFDYGLHEFIVEILTRLSQLAQQIQTDYRFYE